MNALKPIYTEQDLVDYSGFAKTKHLSGVNDEQEVMALWKQERLLKFNRRHWQSLVSNVNKKDQSEQETLPPFMLKDVQKVKQVYTEPKSY